MHTRFNGPFFKKKTTKALRLESELPICGEDDCPVKRGGGAGSQYAASSISVPMNQPSVALVHICYTETAGGTKGGGGGGADTGSTGPYTILDPPPAPVGLRLRTTTTPGELFIRWDDVATRCINTYELLYTPHETAPPPPVTSFVRINTKDTLFTAYVHQQRRQRSNGDAGGAASFAPRGCYAIRVIDYFSQSSEVSEPVCVGSIASTLQPFVNL